MSLARPFSCSSMRKDVSLSSSSNDASEVGGENSAKPCAQTLKGRERCRGSNGLSLRPNIQHPVDGNTIGESRGQTIKHGRRHDRACSPKRLSPCRGGRSVTLHPRRGFRDRSLARCRSRSRSVSSKRSMNAHRQQDMHNSAASSGHRHPAVELRHSKTVNSPGPYTREAGRRAAPLSRTARPTRRRSSSRTVIRRGRLPASRYEARFRPSNWSARSYSDSYSSSSSDADAGDKKSAGAQPCKVRQGAEDTNVSMSNEEDGKSIADAPNLDFERRQESPCHSRTGLTSIESVEASACTPSPTATMNFTPVNPCHLLQSLAALLATIISGAKHQQQ